MILVLLGNITSIVSRFAIISLGNRKLSEFFPGYKF